MKSFLSTYLCNINEASIPIISHKHSQGFTEHTLKNNNIVVESITIARVDFRSDHVF